MRRPALVALLVLLAPFAALAQPSDWTQIVTAVTPTVARVEVLTDNGKGFCTGVILNLVPGYVVTCAHCVKRAVEDRLAVTVNGRHAQIEQENALLDLAVLGFKTKTGERAIELAPDVPKPGAAVAVLGYPFGIETLMPQAGIVSGYERDTRLLWLNVDVIFGDSGGITFDAQGRLVGLTSAIFSQGPAHMGAAVPLSAVRDFVEDYLPGAKHPAKPKGEK